MLFATLDADWVNATEIDPYEVREIGRSVLARRAVQDGVIGYAMNSFRKLESNPGKWKAGMLRVLYQGRDLLLTGNTSLYVRDKPWADDVLSARDNRMTDGQALDKAAEIIATFKDKPSALPDATDWTRANEWLLALRQQMWS